LKGQAVKELIEYVARSLVDDPSAVRVDEEKDGDTVRLELHVNRDDMGRIIGRSGRVASGMRILLRVAAAREGKQAALYVIEP
jgi:uncharacterized protein